MGILSYRKSIEADKANKQIASAKEMIASDPALLESFAAAAIYATAVADASFFIYAELEKVIGSDPRISRIKSLLNTQSGNVDASGSESLSEKLGSVSDDIAGKALKWAAGHKGSLICMGYALIREADCLMTEARKLLPPALETVAVTTRELPKLMGYAYHLYLRSPAHREEIASARHEVRRILKEGKTQN